MSKLNDSFLDNRRDLEEKEKRRDFEIAEAKYLAERQLHARIKAHYFKYQLEWNCGLLVAILLTLAIWLTVYSSCRSVNVYNGRHATTYSCSDYFFAKDEVTAQ